MCKHLERVSIFGRWLDLTELQIWVELDEVNNDKVYVCVCMTTTTQQQNSYLNLKKKKINNIYEGITGNDFYRDSNFLFQNKNETLIR